MRRSILVRLIFGVFVAFQSPVFAQGNPFATEQKIVTLLVELDSFSELLIKAHNEKCVQEALALPCKEDVKDVINKLSSYILALYDLKATLAESVSSLENHMKFVKALQGALGNFNSFR